jgi:hypothetical protein
MTIVSLILFLCVVGVFLYFFPIEGVLKNIILCVVALVALYTIFSLFFPGNVHLIN